MPMQSRQSASCSPQHGWSLAVWPREVHRFLMGAHACQAEMSTVVRQVQTAGCSRREAIHVHAFEAVALKLPQLLQQLRSRSH